MSPYTCHCKIRRVTSDSGPAIGLNHDGDHCLYCRFFLIDPGYKPNKRCLSTYINPTASEKQILLISRIIVLVLGLIAFLLVSQFKTVLNAAFTAYNIYGTSITPALLLTFYGKERREKVLLHPLLQVHLSLSFGPISYLHGRVGRLSPFLQELTP